MSFKLLTVFFLVAVLWQVEAQVVGKTIIEAPVHCPEGQKPDATGKCREEWARIQTVNYNLINPPVQCPPGQSIGPNGKCRTILLFSARMQLDPNNIIVVPPNCPPGQKPDQDGKCRPIIDFWLGFMKMMN